MSIELPPVMTGKVCQYCDQPTVYTDSAEVYGGRSYGMIYLCRPCNAYVGVHKGTDTALGMVANNELRTWKKAAHDVFDSLWRRKAMHALIKREHDDIEKTAVWKNARQRAYAWLSEAMGLHPDLTHIGMMDVQQCKVVIGLCQQVIDNIKSKQPQPAAPATP